MRLQNKVCLITGGSAGIGWATAERFAREGAIVMVCDINEPDVSGLGEDAAGFVVDVTDREAVDSWIQDVLTLHGRIDVLVNNAGITRDALLVKVKNGHMEGQMAEADFDAVIAVNLKGVFNCTQAVAPTMIRQGSGVILNASSVVGLDGNFGQTNYVATKAGVVGMTRVWARELGRYGVRVNAVAPGFILTDMTAKMPEKVLDSMKGHTPLGRLGRPEDVAAAYLFLASEEAAFISGAVLRVDGGLVIGT